MSDGEIRRLRQELTALRSWAESLTARVASLERGGQRAQRSSKALSRAIRATRNTELDVVRDAVVDVFGVGRAALLGQRRSQHLAAPRQAFYLLALNTEMHSSTAVGLYCGGRDHTTVLYGARKATQRIEEDADFAAKYARAKEMLNAK